MQLLVILFFLSTLILIVRIFLDSMDAYVMPFSCPRCAFGGDDDLAGQHQPWYRERRGGVLCRECRAQFKEHGSGVLVEDR
jgi:hypothetical protein